MAGNQLPELLIFFTLSGASVPASWESVTRTLDILLQADLDLDDPLGISYQNS